ncbi:MAG: hypothetical protein R3E90_03880 [Marinicella sp.]|nr:SGNH/GDSL hydrolase family protein [Xanthomonadales bacterium]
MKLFLLILALSGTATANDHTHSLLELTGNKATKGETYQLLFVGNSLTYSNNLPKLVKKNARDKGIHVETKMLAKPNYAIVDHWAEGHVQNLIKSKQYDYVIIQQGPSSQADGYNMLINGGKLYSDLCIANDAKLVYFMVWPSRRFYHTFDGVIANYTAGAEANDAILSPVGKVWKAHFDATNDFSYYGSDQFHPSLKGSKVAADVIVDTLFQTAEEQVNYHQSWLIGVGNIKENTIRVEEMFITEKGVFGENFNPDNINNIHWGSLDIDFTACHQADIRFISNVTYYHVPFGAGSYSIERLAMNKAGMKCEEGGFFNQTDKSFFSGTFFGGPQKNGEGFNIDYLNEQQAIITWFTYLPSNQTETDGYTTKK